MYLQFGSYAPKVVFTIAQKRGLASFVFNDKNYVLGFSNKLHAMKVKEVLHAVPRISVVRRDTKDITEMVNESYAKTGETNRVENITMDVNTETIFEKSVLNNSKYCLKEYDYEDFTCLPYSNSIGILLPIEFCFEDNKKLVFNSIMVDAAFNHRIFRTSLSI